MRPLKNIEWVHRKKFYASDFWCIGFTLYYPLRNHGILWETLR